MTLKDIAQEAGVSISTVSRVINQNNTKAASRETQDHIWEIVRRTGYTPNSMAQKLQRGTIDEDLKRTHSIACIYARTQDASLEPFWIQLFRSIEQEAFRKNYILKHSFSAFDLSSPLTYRTISDYKVDGAVVLGRFDKELLYFLKKNYKHVVYTGLNNVDEKYDQIICDGCQASIKAMEYLIHSGHTDIGYIGEKKNEDRYLGYCYALNQHKLPVMASYVSDIMLSSEGGYQGAVKLLRQTKEITAVLCANDLTAIGALRAFRDMGISVPKNISVISIDDIDTAQYLSPMLTTIHIPLEELGQITAKTLIDRIEGGHRLPLKICLPFYIAKRESCIERKNTIAVSGIPLKIPHH